MKRREFLNAALAGMAAITLMPVPTKAVPFSEVFQPAGAWMDLTTIDEFKPVKTLDDIFKKAYADKVQFCHPTPLKLMAEPAEIYNFRVKLYHENGFTKAR
jgi:hypothetical protein